MAKIGVLALQGDFLEHVEMLKEIGAEPIVVKRRSDLEFIDGLIIPGGESTTIGGLITARGLGEPIRRLADRGIPIMGTCAGAILLAKEVSDKVVGETGQELLGLMDIEVVRNAFGRQANSFIAELEVEGIGKVRAAFIRAPAITRAWGSAKIISYVEHPKLGKIGAAAIQWPILALTFHPEITGERGVYELFISIARK